MSKRGEKMPDGVGLRYCTELDHSLHYQGPHHSPPSRHHLLPSFIQLTVRCTQEPLAKSCSGLCWSRKSTRHSYQPWSSTRSPSIWRDAPVCSRTRPVRREVLNEGTAEASEFWSHGPFPEVENSLGLSSKIKGLQRSLRGDCYVPSF